MKNATGRIRVLKMPAGNAPEWVRRASIGLVFPCYLIMGFPENGEPEKDVITGHSVKYGGYNRRSVSVPQQAMLRILARTNKRAALWWRSQGFPRPAPDDCFSFGADEVKIVSGVVPQDVKQYLGILEVGH